MKGHPVKKSQIIALAGAALLAVACVPLAFVVSSGPEPVAAPVETATAAATTAGKPTGSKPTATATQTKTPKPSATPEPINYSVKCAGGRYNTYQAAWEHWDGNGRCEASGKTGTVETQAMKDALEYWAKGDSSSDPLPYIFAVCAEIGAGAWNDETELTGTVPFHAGAAIRLCPDAPNVDHVAALVAAAEQDQAWSESGQMFYGGSFKVGEDIAPGSYYAESDDGFDGCYWERLDSAGNIIDNNFISGGFRAQVYIDASDYSFSSDGCGAWRPL